MKDLTFREATHRYFYLGQELTSVTHAIGAVGITDFSKVPFELMEQAQLIGDYVHEIARLYALNNLDEDTLDPRLSGYLQGIKKFFSENVQKVLLAEARVYDLGLGYAGTCDLVYRNFKRKVCLDDFKTAKNAHPAAQLQTAAYKRPVERLYGLKVDERAGVHIRGLGDYDRIPYHNPADFGDFVHALAVARWKQKHKIRT